MKYWFYEVNYLHTDKNGEHIFLLGYFSSISTARQAIDKVRNKPGFYESDGIFECDRFAVYFDAPLPQKSGVTLYEVSHEYTDTDGYDKFVIFGLYSTIQKAEIIKATKEQITPYSLHPEGFLIAEVTTDQLGWQEGFVSDQEDTISANV